MNNSSTIGCIILTRNEDLHIDRCIASARRVTDVIHVIDSASHDRTREIAVAAGATVHVGTFANFAEKLNWTIDTIDLGTPWTLRLDADEVLSDNFVSEVTRFVHAQPEAVAGIFVRRRIWFMGKPMRFGGVYPRHTLRLWRPHQARCENRILDEYMFVRGATATLEADIEDIPLNGLTHWIAKHNEYSDLEARTDYERLYGGTETAVKANLLGTTNQRIRWLKEKIFYRLPLFVRPLLYFLYRFVVRGGIFDGKEGLIFHFLHAFWYRFAVDAKIVELRRQGETESNGKSHDL
jgi:glycosyltransferase involved in cell wall biosynthesis